MAETTQTLFDFYSTGSGTTVLGQIPTSAGFQSTAFSARMHKHQNLGDTRPVGVPGTTYTPHYTDDIFRSKGGHYIVMGNSPGNETVRIQGASQNAIELSQDGSVKVVSEKGMHVSISADGHMVIHGDFDIVVGGNFRVKAGSVYFDCTDFVVNAAGNHMTHVAGDLGHEVQGDAHTSVTGDNSHTVGGDLRATVAGSSRSQVAGDRKDETTGTSTSSTKGNVVHETKGTIDVRSEGNATYQSKAKIDVNAVSDLTNTTTGKYTVNSTGDATVNTQAKLTTYSGSTTAIGSISALSINSGSSYSVNAASISQSTDGTQKYMSQQGATFGSAGNTAIVASLASYVGLKSANPMQFDSSTIVGPVPAGSGSVSTSITGTGGSVFSVAVPTLNVANANPQVPDEKTVHDQITDLVATDYQVKVIYNAEQLYAQYLETSDGGGELPEKVKSRAVELGIDVDLYKTQQAKSLQKEDYTQTAMSTYSGSDIVDSSFDPLV